MAKVPSSSNNSDPHQQQQQQQQHFLQITQHDKFYSRLLSKESSLANPSFRIYYGGASSAVPFMWESQPGMPKKTVTATTLPPLTPPPSYSFTPKKKKKAAKKPTRSSNLIQCIHPRVRRSPNTSTSDFSPQLESPSSSSTTSSSGSHQSRYSSPISSFSSSRADDEDSDDGGSPTSTLRGCYSMLILKNALLQFVGGAGHGSC